MTKIVRKRKDILNKEAFFSIEELFFSITNLKGEIEVGNSNFYRIAEYSPEDLIGQPHNVIRHPDMPRAVFHLLWQYLQQGKGITAYVINRTKSGKFYWVFGVFSPIKDGESGQVKYYLSVRLKPTSKRLAAVRSLYAQMLEIETESDMDASTDHLLKTLETLGFANYDAFMRDSLQQEMAEYLKNNVFDTMGKKYRPRGRSDIHRCQRILQTVVNFLNGAVQGLSTTDQTLQGISTLLTKTRDFFSLTKDSSMNVAIASGKLPAMAARQLGPVVFELIEIASSGEKTLDIFDGMFSELLQAQEAAMFSCNKALLHSGCLLSDVDYEIAQNSECDYAGKVANVTLRDLTEMSIAMRAFLGSAQGLSDLIGRKLGYSLILGRTLCAQGIVQAEGSNAGDLLNTLGELQKEISSFEVQLDRTAQEFGDMTSTLRVVELAVMKSSESYETIDELLSSSASD